MRARVHALVAVGCLTSPRWLSYAPHAVGHVAQLGRAPAWHAGGQGFESPQLHSPERAPITVGSNPFRDRLGYWMDRVAAGDAVIITRHGKPRIRLSPATRVSA